MYKHNLSSIFNSYIFFLIPCFLFCSFFGCKSNEIEHDENRGVYSAELKTSGVNETELIKKGYKAQDSKNWEQALKIFDEYIIRFPAATVQAFEAHRQRIRCLAELEKYAEAHESMLNFIELYKEFLHRSTNIAFWEDLRKFWFEKIALPVFYADAEMTKISDDAEDSIEILQSILDEEPKGPYSAKCLLLMGDFLYEDEEYWEARIKYIMIVKFYQNFSVEREEALFKASAATAAALDGRCYDQDMIKAVGSELIDRGALDFCEDYLKEYPQGNYLKQIIALKNNLIAILAYRLYHAGRVYSKLGFDEAAKVQYLLTIKKYDFPKKFPNCTEWVQKAKDELIDMGISDYTKDTYWQQFTQ